MDPTISKYKRKKDGRILTIEGTDNDPGYIWQVSDMYQVMNHMVSSQKTDTYICLADDILLSCAVQYLARSECWVSLALAHIFQGQIMDISFFWSIQYV